MTFDRRFWLSGVVFLSITPAFSQQASVATVTSHTLSYYAPVGTPATGNTATADLTFNLLPAPRVEQLSVHVEAQPSITVYPTGTTPVRADPFVFKVTPSVKASGPDVQSSVRYNLSTSVGVPGHDSNYCYQATSGSANPVAITGPTVNCSIDSVYSPRPGEYWVTTTIVFGWAFGSGEFTLRTVYQTSGVTADLAITGFWLVQVTHAATELPLIANRETVARVFIRSLGTGAPAVNNVTAVLRSPLSAVPYERTITVPITARPYGGPIPLTSVDFTEDSVDFALPMDWVKTAGGYDLTAEITVPPGVTDPNLANNTLRRTMVLHPQPQAPLSNSPPGEFRVGFVTIDLQPLGAASPLSVTGALDVSGNVMKRLYPLAENGLDYRRVARIRNPYRGSLASPADDQAFVAHLRTRFADILAVSKTSFDQLVVFVPWSATNPYAGLSDPLWSGGLGEVAMVMEGTGRFHEDQVVAHEIGHNLGLRHVVFKPENARGCGVTAPDDCEVPFWPYEDPTIQYPGYFMLAKVLVPAHNFDFMSYCGNDSGSNLWISPAYFQKLFDNQLGPADAPCPPKPKALSFEPKQTATSRRSERKFTATPQEYLVVSGSVTADGLSGQLEPVFRLTTTRVPPASSTGSDYCLRFPGAASTSGDFCFPLAFTDGEGSQLTRASFSVIVAAPAGATGVSLMHGGTQLASISGGAQAPAVSIGSPKGGDTWSGAQNVTWSGTGARELRYLVDYSYDGGATWVPMTLETTDTSLSASPGDFLGPEVLFRVQASDGFRTATAQAGPVKMVQSPRIAASPSPLDLRNGLVSVAVEGEVVLTNRGSGPLQVSAIAFADPAFRLAYPAVPFQIFAGDSVTLGVRFSAPAAGTRSSSMTISSNAVDTPSLAIPIRATGVTELTPDAEMSAESVDFGEVPQGASATQTVKLRNYGPGRLQVNAVTVSGAGFRLASGLPQTPFPLSLETVPITVQFAPSQTGAASGTLRVATSDTQHPSFTVSLRGSGVAAGSNPQVAAGGVVNAASFVAPIARCALGTVFGTNLAGSTAGASALPLPTRLGGAEITVGGIAAPLVYVSPGQINFQVPCELPLTGSVPLTVTNGGAVSTPQTVTLAAYAPGVFTYARTATAVDPIVVHAADNSLVTPSSPARGGEYLVIYATGAGKLDNVPATGFGAPSSPLSATADLPTVTLGGAAVTVGWAGLTPGFVGLVQINVQLPAVLPTGASLPLVVAFAGTAGPPVNLAVQGAPAPGTVLVSDSFSRSDAGNCALGRADLAKGGSGSHYYLPIFGDPVVLSGGSLLHSGLDYGGVQLTASSVGCSGRGETFPQDLYIAVDLMAPASAAGIVQAGPYFRSRAAAPNDGIIGGTSAGYWIVLTSTGEVRLRGLNPNAVIATSVRPAAFDSTVFHTLVAVVRGSQLQVWLDGSAVAFSQSGGTVTAVTLPATGGSNDGTVGLAFADEDNRGKAGGQRARNLVIAQPGG